MPKKATKPRKIKKPKAAAAVHIGLPRAVSYVTQEFLRAKRQYPSKFNSAHEGYAIILEELDELWDEVKKKQSLRSKAKMRKECIQIAAMAVQFALELT